MTEFKNKRPLQFGLLTALIAMLVIGIGSGYYGKQIRERWGAAARERQSAAELERQVEKLAERKETTWKLIEEERARIDSEHRATGGTGSRSGRASWESRLRMSLSDTPDEKLAAVEVSAKITEDRKLSNIKIESGRGTQDASIIQRLTDAYDANGWPYKIIEASELNDRK